MLMSISDVSTNTFVLAVNTKKNNINIENTEFDQQVNQQCSSKTNAEDVFMWYFDLSLHWRIFESLCWSEGWQKGFRVFTL